MKSPETLKKEVQEIEQKLEQNTCEMSKLEDKQEKLLYKREQLYQAIKDYKQYSHDEEEKQMYKELWKALTGVDNQVTNKMRNCEKEVCKGIICPSLSLYEFFAFVSGEHISVTKDIERLFYLCKVYNIECVYISTKWVPAGLWGDDVTTLKILRKEG